MKKYIILLILISYSVFASNAGTTSGLFQNIPISAKQWSLGNAYTAGYGNPSISWTNPAGMYGLVNKNIFFQHNLYLANIKTNFLNYTQPINIGNIIQYMGVSILYLSSGNIKITREDPYGILIDTEEYYSVKDYALNLSYMRNYFSINQFFGINVRLMKSSIYNYSTDYIAVDLGYHHILLDNKLHLGGILKNIGPKVTFINESFMQPITLKLGGLYEYNLMQKYDINLYTDISGSIDDYFNVAAGIEFIYDKWVSFRAGWNKSHNIGYGNISVGFGVKIKSFNISYAYYPVRYSTDSHIFSLWIRLR